MAGRRCAGAKMGLIKTGEWSEIDPTFPGGATEADGAYFVLDTPGQLNLFQWNSRRPDCGNGPLRLMLTVESWDSLLDAAKSAQQKSAGQQSHRHIGHWSMKNLNENCTRDDDWTHISLKTATTSIYLDQISFIQHQWVRTVRLGQVKSDQTSFLPKVIRS